MRKHHRNSSSEHQFDQQIEKYMKECSQCNVDIVGMNRILTQEKRWLEYDELVAENQFIDNGTHIGISTVAYAVIMGKLKRKRSATDVLVQSERIGIERVKELQNRSKRRNGNVPLICRPT